jgi:ABC-2 type transport system permease protein
MMNFRSAFWAESLKARRSRVPWMIALGFCIAPAMGGLFMVILKDPEAARSMGLISAKANLAAGEASWAALFNMLSQAIAVGGAILFGMLTAWVFGREFSDRTVKELLALPTARSTIVLAKFLVVLGWTAAITLLVFAGGLLAGFLVKIPGWSSELLRASLVDFMGGSLLTILLLPFVALVASLGRGYLPAFGWMMLTVILSQISAITGWGDYFPWAIPALFAGAAGPRSGQLGPHSYLIVPLASLLGIAATLAWWRSADQTR